MWLKGGRGRKERKERERNGTEGARRSVICGVPSAKGSRSFVFLPLVDAEGDSFVD